MKQSLSFYDIAKMFKALFPPLYYTTEKAVGPGAMYYVEKTKFMPECVICHPDDLERVRAMSRPLVHLREWEPRWEPGMIVDPPRPLPRPGSQPTPPTPDPWPGLAASAPGGLP